MSDRILTNFIMKVEIDCPYCEEHPRIVMDGYQGKCATCGAEFWAEVSTMVYPEHENWHEIEHAEYERREELSAPENVIMVDVI